MTLSTTRSLHPAPGWVNVARGDAVVLGRVTSAAEVVAAVAATLLVTRKEPR